MFKRTLRLPPAGTETFFLWGPQQTGKTTLTSDRDSRVD
jgi:predicted AAA+ superfamily ATPase